ncbi:MAG: ABC transporter ATP-binding protein [Kiritimatiellaeota bacterium]|nr:ABC transporter ATP-binding protein [Kiritimatiellota bacterium]
MTPAIELQGVTAGYRRQDVLHELSLTVGAGEWVALLGPNGAGKSTLLRVLTGLHPATAGSVRLFGRDLCDIRPAERARLVAVVPQELVTPMAYTVEELVTLGRLTALSRWARPAAADLRIVERALAYTDTLELRDRPYDELSGGEKQRAAIALALAQEPQLILLDEPTAHLDINHRLEILQLIERLNVERKLTVLLASHDLNLAAEFCGRLLLLDHGQIVADGTPAAVLREDRLREVYHCDLLVRPDAAGTPAVVPDRKPRLIPPEQALRIHVICGGGSGAELLRHLRLAGHHVTCGVLNAGDSDARAAGALDAELALEQPFSPIGAAALDRARQLATRAAVVVLCDVPFGPGNLVNLALAEEALARGAQVLVNSHQLDRRDFTLGREALPRLQQMLARGAQPWLRLDEVHARLAALLPPPPSQG